MAHVITQPCCNDAGCVAVCPVDCIHPTPDEPGYAAAEMLYINGDECIDCGACVDACPVAAIVPEEDLTEAALPYVELNALHYQRDPEPTPVPRAPRLAVTGAERLRVAIVGSGPAAAYAAEELLSYRGLSAEVTMFERLLTPWGLVRFGVAPDHPRTKAVTTDFEITARRRGLTLHLGVEVGTHLTHEELLAHHHAVIYAVGAAADRRLGVPGEDLPGSAAATDFVGWYNGHPDFAERSFDLSNERVVVVGNGNVALDVARVLTAGVDQLARTDIADYALDALAQSAVREVVVVGRRGPDQAAYSTSELLTLRGLSGVDVVAQLPKESPYVGDDPLLAFRSRVLTQYATHTTDSKNRRIVLRYQRAPQEILGADRVAGIRLVGTELVTTEDGSVQPRPTHLTEDIPCGLVLRAVGYRGRPIAGLPFDTATGVVPNDDGRVIDTVSGAPIPGAFVAGWIKRGPSGGIGTNKKCAQDTVAQLLCDFVAGRLPTPHGTADDLAALLDERRSFAHDYASWAAIDEHERAHGAAHGRPRVKVTDPASLDRIGILARSPR